MQSIQNNSPGIVKEREDADPKEEAKKASNISDQVVEVIDKGLTHGHNTSRCKEEGDRNIASLLSIVLLV